MYWHQQDIVLFRTNDLFQNNPLDNWTTKGPTSNWAFEHKADVDAHHAKYTDAEAQTAVNLNGTLYWSCPGIAFDPVNPASDAVSKAITGVILIDTGAVSLVVSVNLPDGATVTGAIVYGNAGSEDETWLLRRITVSGPSNQTLATAAPNTEDTSIDSAVIDNSLYNYFIVITNLETSDQIYGSRISFTL